MRIYHVTQTVNLEPILCNGFYKDKFHDFADRALFGDAMFEGDDGPFSAISIDIPDDDLAEYEDTEFFHQHPDHREWIGVPGELLNQYLTTAQSHEDPSQAN